MVHRLIYDLAGNFDELATTLLKKYYAEDKDQTCLIDLSAGLRADPLTNKS